MVVESATCNELSGEPERSHHQLKRRGRERQVRGERERETTVDVSLATSARVV